MVGKVRMGFIYTHLGLCVLSFWIQHAANNTKRKICFGQIITSVEKYVCEGLCLDKHSEVKKTVPDNIYLAWNLYFFSQNAEHKKKTWRIMLPVTAYEFLKTMWLLVNPHIIWWNKTEVLYVEDKTVRLFSF